MHYLGTILASIVAYFIGSISWSITTVRWRKGIDIRTVGSGNAGATNTYRVLGAGWAFFVVMMDALKVPFAAAIAFLFSMIPHSLFSETSYLIPAVFVLIGHCWPVYYGFKGGKAVACFIGLIFISNIWYFFIFLIVWWLVAAISRRVSVASIVAVASIFILVWIPQLHGINTFAWHWNEAHGFWITGSEQYGWQNSWMRFDWFNYFHKFAFDYQVNHGLVLHDVVIKDHLDVLHYGMARWASAPDNTTGLHAKDIYGKQVTLENWNVGYAEGMLEMAICMVAAIAMILMKHYPNMKRIAKKEEPVTFPKLTEKEKAELKELKRQEKISAAEKKRLKKLEKKRRKEQESLGLMEKIKKINEEIKIREAKHAKKKANVKAQAKRVIDPAKSRINRFVLAGFAMAFVFAAILSAAIVPEDMWFAIGFAIIAVIFFILSAIAWTDEINAKKK